jgi:hypothetical protein
VEGPPAVVAEAVVVAVGKAGRALAVLDGPKASYFQGPVEGEEGFQNLMESVTQGDSCAAPPGFRDQSLRGSALEQ